MIVASAPGSLMLLGEHAVLHGHQALVCAIDRRILVRLEPIECASATVEIVSALGHVTALLAKLPDEPSLRFVLEAVRFWRSRMPGSLRLTIESEFSADIGFGSSAAVTVALHAALWRWIERENPAKEALFEVALKSVHAVQGRGSGADLAAAVWGGVVAFSTQPSFRAVPVELPLTAVYCGYKTPTPEVIASVEVLRRLDPEKYDRIYGEMEASAGAAIGALEQGDLQAFGAIVNRNQMLMDEMGVNTPELAEIVHALQQDSAIYGAKISGSGRGDCAIGIGTVTEWALAYSKHPLAVSPKGVMMNEA